MRSLLSFVCVVLTCSSVAAQPLQPMGMGSFYPAKKGAVWTYQRGKDKVTVRVKEVTKMDKDEVVELETSINDTPQATEHLLVKADSVSRLKVAGKEAKPPMTVLKLPPKKGDTWKVDSKLETKGTDGKVKTESVVGAFAVEDVKEEMMNMNKVKVAIVKSDLRVNGQPMTMEFHYAEGIGMIKHVAALGGVTNVVTFVRYDPPKDIMP